MVKNFKGRQKYENYHKILDMSFQDLLAMRGKKLGGKYDLTPQTEDGQGGGEGDYYHQHHHYPCHHHNIFNQYHSNHHHQEIKREEMKDQMVVDSCAKSANLRQGKRGK